MTVLVTAANSFLGRHVVRDLAGAGIAVVGTYRTESAATLALRTSLPEIDLLHVDLANPHHRSRLPERIDSVIHIAGVSTAPGITVTDMLACNVEGARALLDYALSANASRLVYASTMSVYGRIDEPVVNEATPIRDAGVYGASKYVAERLFAEHTDSLPGASIRLPGVLGPGAHRAWIPTLAENMRANRPVTVYGPDNRFNNAAHVDDLAKLFRNILASSEPGFPAFPVGAAGETTVGQLVQRMLRRIGSKSQVATRDTAAGSFTICSRFAEERFGYRPLAIDAMLDRYCSEFDETLG